MDTEKRKKKHLSTIHTARLFSNCIILFGFVLVLMSTVTNLVSPIILLETDITDSIGLILMQKAQEMFVTPMFYVVVVVMFWAGYSLKLQAVLVETQVAEH